MSYSSCIKILEGMGFSVQLDYKKAKSVLEEFGFRVTFEHWRYPVVYEMTSVPTTSPRKYCQVAFYDEATKTPYTLVLDLLRQKPANKMYRYYRSEKSLNTFSPYPKGGKTVCRIWDDNLGIVGVGESFCMLCDNFNYKEGRRIALEDAIRRLGSIL